MIAGLRYAFPRAMRRHERRHLRLGALHDAVAARPLIALYLDSDRRLPFNEQGIFRHYPELDLAAPVGHARPRPDGARKGTARATRARRSPRRRTTPPPPRR